MNLFTILNLFPIFEHEEGGKIFLARKDYKNQEERERETRKIKF